MKQFVIKVKIIYQFILNMDKAGEIARAAGDAAVSAGEKLKKFDEQHHVVDKTKKMAVGVVEKGKEFDEKHSISKTVVEKGKDFDEKHHISDTTKKVADELKKLGEKAGAAVSDALKPRDGQ